MKAIWAIFLFLLLGLTTCTVRREGLDSSKTVQAEAAPKNGDIIVFGYVRSIQARQHYDHYCRTSYNHTMVAFEDENKQVFNILFRAGVANLWQGLHAVVICRPSMEVNACSENNEYCSSEGSRIYDLVSVRRLD